MVMSENKSKNKKGSRLCRVTWRTEHPGPTLCRAATRWSTGPTGPDLRMSGLARIPSIYEARIKYCGPRLAKRAASASLRIRGAGNRYPGSQAVKLIIISIYKWIIWLEISLYNRNYYLNVRP